MGDKPSEATRLVLVLTHVIYDEPARKAANEAEDIWGRTDDAVIALEWALMHDPKAGDVITESGETRVIVYQGAKSAQMPTITAIYSFSTETLFLHDLKFDEPKAIRHGTA